MEKANINQRAFDLLINIEERTTSNEKHILNGSQKEQVWNDMSDKYHKPGIGRSVLGKNVVGISFENENIEIGLNGENYISLTHLIKDISNLTEFEKISYEALETESFSWMYDVYVSKKANNDLITHLISIFESVVKEWQFFFPITNLSIIEPFKIGHIEVTYFTRQHMDELYEFYQNALTPITEEDFDKVYRNEFQGRVIAKSEVFAESTEAEKISKNRMEIAIDVLKIFGLSQQDTRDVRIFDLNYKVNMPDKATFLSKEKPKDFEYLLSMQFENSFLFKYPPEIIKFQKENGLELMSNFIKKESNDELYNLLINGIKIYSAALSTVDLHMRAIMIMTLFESLLLEDEDSQRMTTKTKRRISNVLSNDANIRNEIMELFDYMYQIRHKMVHKAIKIQIDNSKYNKAQMNIVQFLGNLIIISNLSSIKDKPSLIKYIESLT